MVWILFGSCYEDPNCIGLRNDVVGFTFRKLYDKKVDTVNVVGVSIAGLGETFYTLRRLPGTVYLPLNVSANEESFTFELDRGSYSMVAGYRSQPQFESEDCSPRFILSNLNVLQYSFDSVKVTNSIPLSGTTGSNIDIYRCPITNNFKVGFRQLYADESKPNGDELKLNLNGASVSYLPIIYYSDTLLSSLVLPLNTFTNTTSIELNTKDKGIATLNLAYTFEAKEKFKVCGSQEFIKDIQATGYAGFDIVKVVRDSIYDPPTTNVLMLRCPRTNLVQLQLKNASGVVTKFDITKVTTDYTAEEFYVGASTANLILPLDENLDQTNFTVEFASGPKQISFGYERAKKTFHESCNQTLFSSVKVISSDFTTGPVVKNDSIQFPTVVNFEVIND